MEEERIVVDMFEWESIAGVDVKSPVMLAAGVLGETYGLLKRVEAEGAGALVSKSIGSSPNPGYRGPIVVEVEGGFLNAVGLANPGYVAFKEEMLEGVAEDPFTVPVFASVYGANASEFREVTKGLEDVVDGFELNLSCPHSECYGLAVGSDPKMVAKIIAECRRSTKKPLVAKLSPNVPRIEEVARSVEKAGVDAICAINTVGPGMAIEVESMRPVLSNRKGGLSGPCIRPIAVRCIYEIFDSVDVPIIGVGGVGKAEDAIELMEAGATWVQLGTALYGRELSLFREVASGIEDFLVKHGITHREIIGCAHGGG